MITEHNSTRTVWCVLLVTIIMIMASPAFILAQGNPINNPPATYTPLEPLPCIESPDQTAPDGTIVPGVKCPNGNGSLQTEIDFKTYVQYTFNLIIALSSAAAVFMIVWGGFRYMTTASFTEKASGLETVKKALLGLLLILCSYILLRTIDPRLVAIPTTLVKPLNIDYTNTTSSFLSTLEGSLDPLAQKYGISDAQLTADSAAAKQMMSTLSSQRAMLVQQICNGSGEGAACNPADICNQEAIKNNPQDSLYAPCQGLNQLATVESSVKTNLAGEYARNAMDKIVNSCSDQNIAACKAAVNTWRNDFAQAMASQGIDPQKIYDNASYSNAMLDIYDALAKYNPTAAALVNFSQSKNSIVPGGGTIASVQNWLLPSSLTTAGTLRKIRSIANSADIKDPAIRAQLDAQVSAINSSFGIQPPGTGGQ